MSDVALEEAAPEAQQKKPARRGGSSDSRTLLLLSTSLLLLLPIAPSTFAVAVVYMAPTLVIACLRTFHMPGAISTVAGMNLAGTLPALHHLWTEGNNFELAFQLLFNLEFLGIGMAAAGMGLALLFMSPFIARTWVDIASQHLLHKAEAEKEKLLDEWGADLAEEADAERAEPEKPKRQPV